MKKQIRNNHESAIRYFEGKNLPEEEVELFRFVRASSDNERLFRQWENDWILERRQDPEISKEWSLLHSRMQVRQSLDDLFTYKYRRLQRFAVAVTIACLFLLGGACALLLYRDSMQTTEKQYVVETGNGEKTRLTLADGTVVWLNAASSLHYSNFFGSKKREVYLRGEAYFEVTEQPDKKPFLVKTDQYDVLVKGTKFNVASYPEDLSTQTALLEGAVDILYKDKRIPVTPGELLVLDRESDRFSRRKVQAVQYRSWTEGRVEYDRITLEELAIRLSHKYDVRIHFSEKQEKEMLFRVSLRNEETIEAVLQALSEIIPIRYERQGKEIYVRKQ